LATTDVVSKFV